MWRISGVQQVETGLVTEGCSLRDEGVVLLLHSPARFQGA